MKHEDAQVPPADVGRLETPVRPCAWMAQHGREPVQATVSQQQAEAWAQAGGDVVELYDGPTLWNAVASAARAERERLAKVCDYAADIAWAHWQCDADPTDQGRALAAEELAAEFRKVCFAGPNAELTGDQGP